MALIVSLFFQFAFLRRVSRAFEINAVAVGIAQPNYPEAVSHKWAIPRLYSA